MKKHKISVIGAGGGFVIGLIHDLCLTPGLHGSTVSLMDVNEKRLALAEAICRRHAREMGAALTIETTLDRREALKDADFVVTVALIDGPRRLQEGWAIALKHGYRWPGSFHIMYDEPFWLNFYQLQLFESITRDILEVCPAAWHLLVSNPVIAATTLIQRKYPQAKMVGMCHGFGGVYGVASAAIGPGFDPQQIVFEIPGVNHFVWLNHLTHKGEDLLPALTRLAEENSVRHIRTNQAPGITRKALELYQRFGVVPIGDTAHWTGASWPWWYHEPEDPDGAAWNVQMGQCWANYIEVLKGRMVAFEKSAADPSVPIAKSMGLPAGQTGEPMIPFVEAVARDIPRVIVVNTLNAEDFIPGIPRDFEVEIGALVSGVGLRGIKAKPLPKSILAQILRDRVAPVETELAAYAQGSRELLLQLVLMDKWTKSERQANALIDEIFALPYHEELRRHYR
jgi:alpha-galactosidase